MDSLFLLDTSAWITVFHKGVSSATKEYVERLLSEKRVVITPVVILELLSGARNEREYSELYDDLTALRCADMSQRAYQQVYKLAFQLRRAGYAVPTADLLIAGVCIGENLTLVHIDKHFEVIKKHSRLQAEFLRH